VREMPSDLNYGDCIGCGLCVLGCPAYEETGFDLLTARGRKHLEELHAFGLSRFALFVADWSQEEIHTLGALLAKLEASKARVAGNEQLPPTTSRAQRGRSWQEKS